MASRTAVRLCYRRRPGGILLQAQGGGGAYIQPWPARQFSAGLGNLCCFTSSANFSSASESGAATPRCREWLEAGVFPADVGWIALSSPPWAKTLPLR